MPGFIGMHLAVRHRFIPLALVVLFVTTGLMCPPAILPPDGLESGLVTLHIKNQSGFRVVATAEYTLEDFQVRQTIRLLDATGRDADATLLPTRTRLLKVVAIVSPDAELPENARVGHGDVLAEGRFEWQVDFGDGDTLVFVIPGLDQPPTDFIDCNTNGISDALDLISGSSSDCNSNGIPDECDIADGTSHDCNENGVPDECDVASEKSEDCNSNGIPDECDIADGTSHDCNENGVPDECDVASEKSEDCNSNGIPDECDIADGTSHDCNENGVPDECDVASEKSEDCNSNGIPDECDIADGTSHDCNENGVPDVCDIASEKSEDCNSNGIPDECDIADGTSHDCNENGVPDECDIASEKSEDCNSNGIPDECDIADGTSHDCNENGVPDECDIASEKSEDCNENGIPDECDLAPGDPRLAQPMMGVGLLFPLDETFTLAAPPSGTDDTSSAEIELGFSFNLFGVEYDSVYINANGNITFDGPFSSFTPASFPIAERKILAPFWADVDTRNGLGDIWYKLDENTLIVTWTQVGYYDQLGDKRNTFQVAISDGSNPSICGGNNVAFSYGDMQWTTGGASGGILGFGGLSATVGANAGNGTDYFMIGRFDRPGTNYEGPTGLHSGVDFLDGKVFCFDTSPDVFNLPPIASGLPHKSIARLNPTLGDKLDLMLEFRGPEPGQVTSIDVEDLDDVVARGLNMSSSTGNVTELFLEWTPACGDEGLYQLQITAMDDFQPPASTVITLSILVACHSEDCNANGIPDECDTDCNGNGVPDECDIACCDGLPSCSDCNENGIPDGCDVASGHSEDDNQNGIPDECEAQPLTMPQQSLHFKQAVDPIPLDDDSLVSPFGS